MRLHQPALYYGVNSEPLGDGGEDLVSKGQLLGYFDRVLHKLLATSRLSFLPQHEYEGDGRVRSLVAPDHVRQIHHRRLVDATYTRVTVPSSTPPRYEVEPGVPLVPINGLATLPRPRRRYVVVGAGKTGIDAVLYLLARGVAPDAIRWIVSRDAWFIAREHIQPRRFADSVAELPLGRQRAILAHRHPIGVVGAGIGGRLRGAEARPARAGRAPRRAVVRARGPRARALVRTAGRTEHRAQHTQASHRERGPSMESSMSRGRRSTQRRVRRRSMRGLAASDPGATLPAGWSER